MELRPRKTSEWKLAFLVAIACVYLVTWKATIDHEEAIVGWRTHWDWVVEETSVPMPFLIVNTEVESRFLTGAERRFYFWFFGGRKKLVYSYAVDPMPYSPYARWVGSDR